MLKKWWSFFGVAFPYKISAKLLPESALWLKVRSEVRSGGKLRNLTLRYLGDLNQPASFSSSGPKVKASLRVEHERN